MVLTLLWGAGIAPIKKYLLNVIQALSAVPEVISDLFLWSLVRLIAVLPSQN